MSNASKMTNQVAGRYAGALLSLAEEGRALKVVEKDMKTLRGLFSRNVELNEMVASPIIADMDKTRTLLAVIKKAKIGTLVANFVGTVAENGRARELVDIMAAFETMLAAKRGLEIAYVRSAKKLTSVQLKSIVAALKKALGRSVAVETSVDPELLGGFAVQVGSKYFDASLKTKLDGLKLALKEA